MQYPQSNSAKISKVRDLPPVSGSIIWARQIDRQLTTYLRRVEDVLGKLLYSLPKHFPYELYIIRKGLGKPH